MPRYIDAELLMQKLSRMIDYCEKNKDKKFNALNVLFQVGDAIMDCPTADVVPKSEYDRLEKLFNDMTQEAEGYLNRIYGIRAEVAREIFELIECAFSPVLVYNGYTVKEYLAELKKKYTEGEQNVSK